MPKNNYFAEFKDGRLSGASGVNRRVQHSFTNYFQSIDRTSFGIEQGKNPLPHKDGLRAFGFGASGNAAGNAVNTGAALLGTAGLGAGIAVVCVGSLATAAAIAAISGPQAAIAGGVVGLVLLAKSTYSNRESAHVELTKYCWSLIDDEAPSKLFGSVDALNDASSAALTLMDDGKNQIKLLASKLESAKSKLDQLNAKLQKNESDIGNLPLNANNQAGRSIMLRLKILKEENLKLIEAAKQPGGGIYEYARRIVHTSNYIQAPHIISLAMKEKHSPGSVVNTAQSDYFANTVLGTNSRELFARLATIYTDIVTPPVGVAAGGQQVMASRGVQIPMAPLVARTRRP